MPADHRPRDRRRRRRQGQRAAAGVGRVLFAIGLVQAAAGIMRHRFAVTNWLIAAYRVVQLRHPPATVRLGGTLPRKVSTGEVVSIGTTDLSHIGQLDRGRAPRFAGAVVSFFVVAVILLQTSVTLGLVVLIGVPAADARRRADPAGRCSAAAAHQRDLMGQLSNTATDIVGGLRVLRGIGGEQVFHRPLPPRVADARAPRASRSPSCSRCSTLSRSSCPGCSWWSWSGSARGTPSRARSPPASWSRSTATRRS